MEGRIDEKNGSGRKTVKKHEIGDNDEKKEEQ